MMEDFQLPIANFQFRPVNRQSPIGNRQFHLNRQSAIGNWQFHLNRQSAIGNRQSRRLRRRGFSFAEVMFAVIILGIGFIMVAAIFPVAIQQTKLTVEESTAAAVAKDAVSVLEQLAVGSDNQLPPGTPPLFPETQTSGSTDPPLVAAIHNWTGTFNGTGDQPSGLATLTDPPGLWGRMRGNLLLSGDPRFAWTMVFSRESGSSYIRAYIFVVQQTLRQRFTTDDITNPTTGSINLQPRLVRLNVEAAPAGTADPDVIYFSEQADFKYAAPGAFIVIAKGPAGTSNPTGQIFRLGNYRGLIAGADTYELDPAYPVKPGTSYLAEAWIVGRSFVNVQPAIPDPPTEGPAMDVAMYMTFVKVN